MMKTEQTDQTELNETFRDAIGTLMQIVTLQNRLIESLGRGLQAHHEWLCSLSGAEIPQSHDFTQQSKAALHEIAELERLHSLNPEQPN